MKRIAGAQVRKLPQVSPLGSFRSLTIRLRTIHLSSRPRERARAEKCIMTKTFSLILCLLLGGIGASTAHAHISMTGALMSRGGDQKMSPCDGAKGDGPIYTFEPGATITLALREAIPHPSYYRIAFDDDGDDGFVEPKSIKPIEATRACPFDEDDQCGESDFCNVVSATGATVLWDNLNPHTAAQAMNMTWNIKLPDIECENCTIQVLQVMEDTVHGAYCPQGSCANAADSLEDIYHRCIDIKLERGATNSPGTTTAPVNNMGMQCMADGPATMSPDAGAPSAGTGAAGSTAGTGAAEGGAGGMSAGTAGAVAAAGAPSAGAASTPIAGTPSTAPIPVGSAGSGAAGTVGMTSNPASAAGTGTAGAASLAGSAAPAPAPESGEVGGCSVTRPSQHSDSTLIPITLLLGLGLVVGRRARRRGARE